MTIKITLLNYDFIASTNNGFLDIKCLRDGTVLLETSEHIKDGILPYKPRFSAEYRVDDYRLAELENANLIPALTNWLTTVYTMVINNYTEE